MEKYNIYCDESRQDLLVSKKSISNNDRFSCIGGLMILEKDRTEIKDTIKELKRKYHIYGEFKWGTVSPNKIPFYVELVNLFFDSPNMSFRTVVVDASKICNEIYNDNNPELGYYKFYYQLLRHWASYENSYIVFTDQRTSQNKKRLQELKRILNYCFMRANPFRDIQAIDSKESPILQLQNILMGAVGYKYNFCDKGSSAAKEEVVLAIERRLGHKICKTFPSEQKFNVFEIELKEEK